jgi:hypothetical protein
MWGPNAMDGGRQLRAWDTRVAFIEKHKRWWWNAWREATATELFGFADSQEDARQAMYRAIEQAAPWPPPPQRRQADEERGGAAT